MSEELEDLVLRLDDVELEIEKLEEQKAELTAALLAKQPEGGDITNEAGEILATFVQSMRFNADKALEIVPEDMQPLIMESKVVADKVKKLLPKLKKLGIDLEYSAFQTPSGAPKIKIVRD